MNAIVCLPDGHDPEHYRGLASFKNPNKSRTVLVGASAFLAGPLRNQTVAIAPGLGYGVFTTDYISDFTPIHINFPLWVKGGHADRMRIKFELAFAKVWLVDEQTPNFAKPEKILFENDDLVITRYIA